MVSSPDSRAARRSRRIAVAAIVAAALAGTAPAGFAQPQTYPAKPVRVVVNSAPGGLTDVIARLVGARMTMSTGQPFVVDNRTGGAGLIGAEAVARAAPDGYTIGVVAGAITTAPYLVPNAQFDASRDLTAVSLLMTTPMVLVTGNDSPYRTVAQVVQDAKARPAAISVASGGNATTTHLTHELFQQQAGIQLIHVPYKGGGPALNDVMAGHVPIYFDTLTTSTKLIQDKRVRALAVVAPHRLAALPDVPTMAEAGYPGVQASAWFAVVAPPALPPAVLARLNEEVSKALAAPEVRDRIVALGGTVEGGPPAVLSDLIRAEMPRWSKLIKERKITSE